MIVFAVLCLNYVSAEDLVRRENHWLGKVVPEGERKDLVQSLSLLPSLQ